MIIFLIGYMGAGKSYWGRKWAKRHEMDFIDLDESISHTLQISIPEIFDTKGEEFFRQQEAKILRGIPQSNSILACGGGTACFMQNMEWMNQQGITVYLSANVAYLQNNIEKEAGLRPLIQNTGEELFRFISHQITQRNHFYKQAKFTLAADRLQIDSLDTIIETQK